MVNGILFSFFLIPEVKIGKWGPWLGTVPIRRCGNLQGGRPPDPEPGKQRAVPAELEALTRKAPRLVSYLIIAVHI